MKVKNDLYSLMADCPESYHSDCTHFYTEEGRKLIGEEVAKFIEKCL